jgi:hypothetical protein
MHTRNHTSTPSTVGYAEFGGAFCCTFIAAIVSASFPPPVLYAEVGGAPCGCIAAILNTFMASTVLYAEAA